MMAARHELGLWQQLQATARVVGAVGAGQSANAALAAVAPELRPGVQALSFQVWRNLGRVQALRAVLVNKKPAPATDALLCSALALMLPGSTMYYDVHTVVNQAVEAAKRWPPCRAQAPFINACLRRFLREHDALLDATNTLPSAQWNHPHWWIERLQQDHPQHWQVLLHQANLHAPMTLRVNQRQTTTHAYQACLEQSGQLAVQVGPSALRLAKPVPVQQLPGFAKGRVSVQDAAAQLAVPLLLSQRRWAPTHRILDACAAPGGKTAQLLECCDAQVLALEHDAQRAARITETLQRLQLQAQVVVGDAGTPGAWWDGQRFDAILLDAPCTASGIGRRHPDVRWLRRASDVDQLASAQARLLRALWPLLRPGGRMLYCVCSVFAQEGRTQVQTFLTHNTDARMLPSPGHLLPPIGENPAQVSDNVSHDYDGFYLALMEKRPT